ncbi:hypothetical protein [Roseisalinus antarcticus]|uniref:Uncharacterized protein n=1 Tax=Roseisalinus antarcticus TaxID=254357 RepID=A0A1Y5RNS2_9RHOB|nr:hypothetical protein [Roseisalinus antarcticus]SLN21950.1 hypothetical protein ROA7023_00603 [Roseisalinus antarcticus]
MTTTHIIRLTARVAILAAATLLPRSATAQGICAGDLPAPDPCLVGNWIGENTAGMAVRDALERMPGVDVLPDVPPALGLTIYEDGLYVTLPFATNATTLIDDEDGDGISVLITDLAIGTEVGRIWGDGGTLSFCTLEVTPPLLNMDMTASDGTRGAAGFAVTEIGGFTPAIGYTCSDGFLMLDVQLPQPIGTVYYQLSRIADSRFDETFADLVDRRFGID